MNVGKKSVPLAAFISSVIPDDRKESLVQRVPSDEGDLGEFALREKGVRRVRYELAIHRRGSMSQ